MKRRIAAILLIWACSSAAFSQGSVLLVGGGSENYYDWSDQPYRWLVTHAPNRNILVLHYSDTSTFFTGYFPSLSPCTVRNLAIKSTTQANDSATYRFILQYDGIFLRGGDQSQYVSLWKGTLTQKAIKEVFQRGGVIGGSSAGEMVLSEVVFSSGSSNAWTFLRTPATASATLVDDFLVLAPNILAESHTNERGRIGRLPVFLARYKNAKGREVTGVGVDANTALAIGPDSIGEVMGGSGVALLRWRSNTQYAIESGKAFSMSNIRYDQLTTGFKINFATGEVLPPASAAAFTPKQLSSPAGPVLLDGSGSSSDWSASTGSLNRLQTLLSVPYDTVGIITSSAASASAASVNSTFSLRSVPSRILVLTDASKNDPALAAAMNLCGAFVFVDNAAASFAGILSLSTAVGGAFISRINAGKPTLFLSEDVMLAGEYALGGLYTSLYSAYYGYLTRVPALNLVKGVQLTPRFYQNQNNTASYDYSENRVMGTEWSMAVSQLSYGMLIDAGAHVAVLNDRIEVYGISSASSPVLLIDARQAVKSDFSTFHDPGKANAVQSAALTGASLHIIRAGDSFELTEVLHDQSSEPREFFLEQNYPNPFNPATTLRFRIRDLGFVTLKVFDLLGRQVVTLINQEVSVGTYETRWDAAGRASGIYFVRLDQTVKGVLRSQTQKIVLTK